MRMSGLHLPLLLLLCITLSACAHAQGTSPNGFVPVQCTWSADWSAHDAGWNLSFAAGNHNAVNWWTTVQDSGHVSSPRGGSLMVMEYGTTGHVGWVSSVSGNSFVLYHSNWPIGRERHSSNCTFDPGTGQANIDGGSMHALRGFLTRPPDNPPVAPPGAPNPGSGLHVQYCGYVEDVGWQGWVQDGQLAGTEQQAKRMEAIALRATGVGVYYQVHVEEYGWQDWRSNGAVAGTTGCAHRIEGIKITTDPGYSVSYQAQVEADGWQGVVSDGALAGTTGQGKRLEALKVWIVALDSTPPDISLSPSDISGWRNSNQSISWSVTDNRDVAEVRIWWNGEGQSGVGANGSTPMREGANTFHVWARDSLNNGRQVDRVYRLDTAAPAISLTGPATSTWLNTPQSVTWSATDPTSGILDKKLTWDSGGQTNASPTAIPEGKRSATVWAKDNALNEASQTYGPWWVDTAPPAISVSVSPTAPDGQSGWYLTRPTFSVVADDPNGSNGSGLAARYYTLDAQSEVAYTSPVVVPDDGQHAFSARATDNAGNQTTTTPITVMVDSTPPVFSSINTDAQSRSLTTLVASWVCTDTASGIAEFEYWIGSTPGGSQVKSVSSAGLSNWAYVTNLSLTDGGTYHFTVRARDNAGNWSGPVVSSGIRAVGGNHDESPNFNSGGISDFESARISPNYKVIDSIGQFVVDVSASTNYVVEHGYWHGDVGPAQVASVGAAKSLADEAPLQLGSVNSPVVVTVGTATFADRFYVEQPDRSSGIALQYGTTGGPTFIEGDQIWLVGKLNTLGGERIIQYASPQLVGHVDPLRPLFMVIPDLGGGDLFANTRGVLDGIGLNNLGLLIKTCGGSVSYRDPSGRFFYLDNGDDIYDGSHYGVRVICDDLVGGAKLALPAVSSKVVVTGISSTAIISGKTVRAIRPRYQSDISIIY